MGWYFSVMTRRASLCLSLANAAGLVIAAIVMPLISAWFLRVYADLAVPLPWITRAMHSVTIWIYLAWAAVGAALLILFELLVGNKRVMLCINLAAAVLVGMYLMLWLIADMAPLVQLIRGP